MEIRTRLHRWGTRDNHSRTFYFQAKTFHNARKGVHRVAKDNSDEPVSEDIGSGSTTDGPSCKEARLDGRDRTPTIPVHRC